MADARAVEVDRIAVFAGAGLSNGVVKSSGSSSELIIFDAEEPVSGDGEGNPGISDIDASSASLERVRSTVEESTVEVSTVEESTVEESTVEESTVEESTVEGG